MNNRTWATAAGLIAILSACGSNAASEDTTDATTTDGDADSADSASPPDAVDTADAADTVDADTADAIDTSDTGDSVDTGDSADSAEVIETVVVGPCATDSPAGLAGCVEQARYEADLATVAVARPTWTPAWQVTQDLCAERLLALGFTVERHAYGLGTNVIGTRVGKTQPEHLVIVGAHYDSIPQCPGADDNASGLAGALEVARVLAQREHDRTLVIGCWDEEERGLVGSIAAAVRMSRAGRRVVAYFNFEMIGYFSDEPDTQQFPAGFELLFAEQAAAVAANQNRGDFITSIGGDDAAPQLRALEKYGRAVGLPTISLELNAALRSTPLLADLRRSDHAAFWSQGYPAIMLTDSANFRNSAYHCASGPDAIPRLDPVRAAKVLAVTVGAAAEALVAGDASAGATGQPLGCDAALQDCTGDKSKCSIVDNGFGMLQNGCTTSPGLTAAKGESCTRGAGGVGDDDCAPGLFCALFGMPQSTPQLRACRTICTSSDVCAQGETCVRWSGAVVDSGLCMPRCDPFDAASCGEGLACALEVWRFEDGSLVPVCDWSGTAQAEESCGSSRCAPGLVCAVDLVTGQRVCRAPCDADHACAGDATCAPYPKSAVGVCVP